MTPRELLQAGKLSDALQAMAAEVRDHPTDVKRRTFLFELLCFAGEYDRAQKHLEVLAATDQAASLGAVLCHSALHAEKLRQDLFANKTFPVSPSDGRNPVSGVVNGKPFQHFVDIDPRVGARFEIF